MGEELYNFELNQAVTNDSKIYLDYLREQLISGTGIPKKFFLAEDDNFEEFDVK